MTRGDWRRGVALSESPVSLKNKYKRYKRFILYVASPAGASLEWLFRRCCPYFPAILFARLEARHTRAFSRIVPALSAAQR